MSAQESDDSFCSTEVPNVISGFVDTFVDFAVGGQFLGRESQRIPRESHESPQNPVKTRFPAVDRLIAIGDIHGDLVKAKESLRIAGVLSSDEKERWIGGKTVVVQVGDLLDRGSQELKVIYFLERLKRQAEREGGDLHIMNGNHEIMNMEGDFRFATPEAMKEFASWAKWYKIGQNIKEQCGLGQQPDIFRRIRKTVPEGPRARYAALRPGGPISTRFLADHPTVLVVGSTVFAHGGILPSHLDYGLERINMEVRDWIHGKTTRRAPTFVLGRDSVVWTREYSIPSEVLCSCLTLQRTLDGIKGAERMVVGHTIQAPWGINGICENRVIRVDVGMSKGCENAAPEVLEILKNGEIRVLSKGGVAKQLHEKVKPGLTSLLV